MREVRLVLGPERQIEVHRQPRGEGYVEHTVRGPGGRLTSAVVPGFTVDLERLFAC